MYIKNGKTPTSKGNLSQSKLLCHNIWEKGISKTKTILNLNKLPKEIQLAIETNLNEKKLKGKKKIQLVDINAIYIEKTIDYGHFITIYEIAKKLRIIETFQKVYPENYKLALVIIIGKIITKGSKLAIIHWLKRNELIAEKLEITKEQLKKLTEKNLYAVQFDLDNIQTKIEQKWARLNKKKIDEIFLYDITNLYFEGKQNELAKYGKEKKGIKSKKLISIGLITNKKGLLIKIKTFSGNINDSTTVQEQLEELKKEFKSQKITFVGDRGMHIRFNLDKILKEQGKEAIKDITYISALTLTEMRTLEKKGTIQTTIFDKKLVEIENPETKSRLILCTNPVLETESKQFRETMKKKFEDTIEEIQKAHQREIERCQKNIKRIEEKGKNNRNKKLKIQLKKEEIKKWKTKIDKALKKYKLKEIYEIRITKKQITIEYDPLKYKNLGRFDGKYIIESTVEKERLNKEEVRATYKKLQKVEHAFRDMKTVELSMRPIYHKKAETTRSHILLGMFSYAIINEMENKIFPFLKKLKEKLSFKDIVEELKMIKLSVLLLGKIKYEKILTTKLTNMQKTILQALGINEKIFH